MMKEGLPIPKGFVIDKSAFGNIDAVKKEVSDLLLHYAHADGFMVRSSAIGEDGLDASFAGQLDSYIVKNERSEILFYIGKCWESYNNDRVKAYQEANDKYLNGMGVIVQELIDPEYAGVIYSQSHLDSMAMLGEYVNGHGEKLVSGEVNPETFEARKSGTEITANLPFDALTLVKHTAALETFYNHPVDVEWVFKNNKIYIVQCRPITRATASEKIYWSNTNVNENYPDPISPLLYSIARDSYYHYFKNLSGLLQTPAQTIASLEAPFSNIIGAWGAKMYYNMSSIHQILNASPFAGFLTGSFDNFVGYQEGSRSSATTSTFKDKYTFLKSFIRLNRKLESSVSDFENRSNQYKEFVENIKGLDQLKYAFHEFINIRMHGWYKASLADFFAMIYHGVLGKLCEKYFGEDSEKVRNELIQAIPGLISGEPVKQTWRISELIRADVKGYELFLNEPSDKVWSALKNDKEHIGLYEEIVDYINNWGFRCSGELMFTKANYCEEPIRFIELLQGYLGQPQNNPSEIILKKHEESLVALRTAVKNIYSKRKLLFPIAVVESYLFKFVLKQTIKGISSRERARLKQAMLYHYFKQVLLKIGDEHKNNFEDRSDIIFLKYQEIQELLSSSEMLPLLTKELVALRKTKFEESSKLVYPDDFASFTNEYPIPEAVIVGPSEDNGDGLKGMIACGGYIKGRARVLDSVLESHKLKKGDILVTRQTDPGWASIFPLISGLVVERGGMLSHGAIVAREFGIPAVVGVKNATSIIKDKTIIEIKANLGEIIIHD